MLIWNTLYLFRWWKRTWTDLTCTVVLQWKPGLVFCCLSKRQKVLTPLNIKMAKFNLTILKPILNKTHLDKPKYIYIQYAETLLNTNVAQCFHMKMCYYQYLQKLSEGVVVVTVIKPNSCKSEPAERRKQHCAKWEIATENLYQSCNGLMSISFGHKPISFFTQCDKTKSIL